MVDSHKGVKEEELEALKWHMAKLDFNCPACGEMEWDCIDVIDRPRNPPRSFDPPAYPRFLLGCNKCSFMASFSEPVITKKFEEAKKEKEKVMGQEIV